MKKWKSCLIAVITWSIVFCGGTVRAKADEMTDFYEQTAQLIKENSPQSYVNTMRFFIGSNEMFVGEIKKVIDSNPSIVPKLMEGSVFLPLRVIVEEGGGTVQYNPRTGEIVIEDSGNRVLLQIGSRDITSNEEGFLLDSAPVLIEERTFVPLRAVTEGLGYSVVWQEEERSVLLSKELQTMRLIVKAIEENFDADSYGAVRVIKGADNLFILQFGSIADTQKAYRLLQKDGRLVFVEPDRYIPPVITKPKEEITPVDTLSDWGVTRIKGLEYAQKVSKEGTEGRVTVAVLDTGVDYNHSALTGRIAQSGYDLVNGDDNPIDDHFHGTHVAGIVAQCTQGLPIDILPVKVLNDSGAGSDLIVGEGIQYAIDQGADVINLSLREPCQGTSHYLDSMIQKAVASNIVVVAASGNDFGNTKYYCPAHNGQAVIVGAVNEEDAIAPFSNYGQSVDLSAPGVNIVSTIPGNRFAPLSGTSMASPYAAGAAAMFRLEHKDWTVKEIETELKNKTDDRGPAGWDPSYGEGVLNLMKTAEKENSSVPSNIEAKADTTPPPSNTQADTAVPSSNTQADTAVPPSNTQADTVPPSNTQADTAVPPSNTQADTAVPPSNTQADTVPPSNTQADTAVPSSNTQADTMPPPNNTEGNIAVPKDTITADNTQSNNSSISRNNQSAMSWDGVGIVYVKLKENSCIFELVTNEKIQWARLYFDNSTILKSMTADQSGRNWSYSRTIKTPASLQVLLQVKKMDGSIEQAATRIYFTWK